MSRFESKLDDPLRPGAMDDQRHDPSYEEDAERLAHGDQAEHPGVEAEEPDEEAGLDLSPGRLADCGS